MLGLGLGISEVAVRRVGGIPSNALTIGGQPLTLGGVILTLGA